MTTRAPGWSRGRKVLAFLLLPLFFHVAGCLDLDMNVDVKSVDEADVDIEMVDTYGFMELAEEGCDSQSDGLEDPNVEEFTDSEGNFGCRTSAQYHRDSTDAPFEIYEEDGELVFTMGEVGLDDGDEDIDLDDEMLEMFTPNIAITVTFPGEVTYANEGGEVDGNSVTWTGLEALINPIEARAAASGGGLFGGGGDDDASDEDAEAEEAEQDTDDAETETDEGDDDVAAVTQADDDSSSFPLLATILGVALLIVLLLIVVVAMRRSKHNANLQQAGAYPGQHPGQFQQYPYQAHGPQPGHTQQWGQAQQPGQTQQWDQTQQLDQGSWQQGHQGGQFPHQGGGHPPQGHPGGGHPPQSPPPQG